MCLSGWIRRTEMSADEAQLQRKWLGLVRTADEVRRQPYESGTDDDWGRRAGTLPGTNHRTLRGRCGGLCHTGDEERISAAACEPRQRGDKANSWWPRQTWSRAAEQAEWWTLASCWYIHCWQGTASPLHSFFIIMFKAHDIRARNLYKELVQVSYTSFFLRRIQLYFKRLFTRKKLAQVSCAGWLVQDLHKFHDCVSSALTGIWNYECTQRFTGYESPSTSYIQH